MSRTAESRNASKADDYGNDSNIFVICKVSNKYKNDHEYFDNLYKSFDDKDFYANLFTFFMKRDISNFDPKKIPKSH